MKQDASEPVFGTIQEASVMVLGNVQEASVPALEEGSSVEEEGTSDAPSDEVVVDDTDTTEHEDSKETTAVSKEHFVLDEGSTSALALYVGDDEETVDLL